MDRLLDLARKDPAIRGEALEIFRGCLAVEQEPSTAISAVRGLDLLAEPAGAKAAWLKLLNDPRPRMAARSALHLQDAAYAPIVLDLLNKATDFTVRGCQINTLGRLKYEPAFPVILRALDVPETREQAIVALGDLGNPAAIEPLSRWVVDDTQSSMTDDRGWPLRLGDLAAESLRKLNAPPVPMAAPAQAWAAPSAPPLAYRAVTPPPLPGRGRGWSYTPYLPLIAIAFQLPWLAVVVFVPLFLNGKLPQTRAGVHLMDVFGMLPAIGGVVAGTVSLARYRPRGVRQWICLVVGWVLCGVWMIPFSWELLH